MRAQEVKIGDTVFRILPFDPWRQLELFGNLQREILPSVGGVLNSALAKDSERDDKAAIEAFRDLSTRFDGATLKKWAELLIDPEYVSFEIDGREPAKLSSANRGLALPDFSYVLELMYHVGRVNFAGPLTRWAGLSGLAQKARAYLSADSATTS